MSYQTIVVDGTSPKPEIKLPRKAALSKVMVFKILAVYAPLLHLAGTRSSACLNLEFAAINISRSFFGIYFLWLWHSTASHPQKVSANDSFISYASPNRKFLCMSCMVAREESLGFQFPRIDNSVYSHIHWCENGLIWND